MKTETGLGRKSPALLSLRAPTQVQLESEVGHVEFLERKGAGQRTLRRAGPDIKLHDQLGKDQLHEYACHPAAGAASGTCTSHKSAVIWAVGIER